MISSVYIEPESTTIDQNILRLFPFLLRSSKSCLYFGIPLIVLQLMLPDTYNNPILFFQRLIDQAIPLFVFGNFFDPEIPVCPRYFCPGGVSVPEFSVDKH